MRCIELIIAVVCASLKTQNYALLLVVRELSLSHVPTIAFFSKGSSIFLTPRS